MTSHDDILERMTGSNPLPDVEMITDGQLAELTLQVEEARRTGQTLEQSQELIPTRTPVRWLRPAVAFAAALLVAFAVIGAVSVTTGGESDTADQPSATAAESDNATTTTASLSTDAWNPLLATSVAGSVPEPAACPFDSDAATPGPPSQMRPMPRNDDHDGAFDRHLGRIVYVDVAHQTWTFDVCTNTWHQMDARGDPLDTSLVYDVDSDVTIALGPGEFSVYDAAANEWTRPQLDVQGTPRPDGFSGVAYDPVSGLVITTSGSGIWAFDVDSGTLTRIGTAPAELAGYVADLDRLAFVGADTVLVDPRTGYTTKAAQPPGPRPFGWYDFFEADGTVFASATDGAALGICGFDPAALTWSRCFDAAPAELGSFSSKVEDSINNRVVLTQSGSLRSDVWAFDLETEELTEIVPYAPTRFLNESWDPVLATARASNAPEPHSCPAGTDPNRAGAIDQLRPTVGVDDDHDGAFDRRTGHVIYVDTMQRTWAFDVCTNTWRNTEAAGIPLDESLVYDVDSDVTIALGPGHVSVYDATANEWTRPPLEIVGGPAPTSFSGVTYDPVSGLVITTSDDQVWALDVEAGRLTMIDAVRYGGQLAGYAGAIDRLVFVAGGQTVLVDPRSGETTVPGSGNVPESGWGWYDFYEAGGTVFIGANVEGVGEGCGFNPATEAWDLCYSAQSPGIGLFASRVGDPINERVVLIHHSQVVDEVIDAVWALDLATGELTELLAPSE